MTITAGTPTYGSSSQTSASSPDPFSLSISRPFMGDGTLLVAMIQADGGLLQTAPSGWTQRDSALEGARHYLYTTFVTSWSAEPSTYVWTFSDTSGASAGKTRGVIIPFANVYPSDVLDSSISDDTSVSPLTVPQVMTDNGNAMLLVGFQVDNAISDPSVSGMTRVVWDKRNGGTNSLFTQTIANAGLTGTRTITWTGGNVAWGWMVALRQNPVGTITLAGDPVGKLEAITPDFDGTWNHTTGVDMTQVQVRILNSSGSTVLQTGDEYNIADVNSGSGFTVTWGQSGLTALNWGTGYRYQMRGHDGTSWGAWSASRAFSTNSAPTVPSSLSPNTTATAQTSLPLLSFAMSDSDDTVATGLKGYLEIFGADDTLNATVEATYNSGNGRWEYQTTSAEVDAFETFTWDAYGYDGTLYSGEATSAASATRSATASFIYAEGPEVTVSSPAADEVLTSNSLTVTWSIDTGTQQSYEIYVYDDTGARVIDYDGGLSSSQTHTFTDVQAIRNGESYTVVVHVETTLAATGNSAPVAFSVDYPAPDSLTTFTAEAVKIGSDLWPSAVSVAWSATEYGTDVFSHYTIWRTVTGGPDDGTITLAIITDPDTTTYIDDLTPSGVPIEYRITQSTIEGADFVTSDALSASASITLGGVVLCAVADPATLRTSLRYTGTRDYPRSINEAVYQPSDGADPTTVRSPQRTRQPAFDVKVFADAVATAAERLAELEALDIAGGTLCYRDNHGRKLFVTMPQLTITDHLPDWFTAKIGLRGERYREGVS